MNESDRERNEELVIEDIGMSAKIRSLVVKEKLPEDLSMAMEKMDSGQSVFIKTTQVTKKMYALRSKYYRWKHEDDPHLFSLIQETDREGNTGIRMYKYIPDED